MFVFAPPAPPSNLIKKKIEEEEEKHSLSLSSSTFSSCSCREPIKTNRIIIILMRNCMSWPGGAPIMLPGKYNNNNVPVHCPGENNRIQCPSIINMERRHGGRTDDALWHSHSIYSSLTNVIINEILSASSAAAVHVKNPRTGYK